jgi:hypothetical protein
LAECTEDERFIESGAEESKECLEPHPLPLGERNSNLPMLSVRDLKTKDTGRLKPSLPPIYPRNNRQHKSISLKENIRPTFSLSSKNRSLGAKTGLQKSKSQRYAGFGLSKPYVLNLNKKPSVRGPQVEEEKSFLDEEEQSIEIHAGRVSFSQGETNQQSQHLTLYIDDLDAFNFRSVIGDLCNNQTTKKVEICRSLRGKKRRKRTPKEMLRALIAVFALPKLETLGLRNFEATEIDDLIELLQEHPTLSSFQLHLASGTISRASLQVLTTVPRLTEVIFEANKSFPFAELLRSQSLKILRITYGKHAFQDNHVFEVARKLQENSSIEILDLKPTMSAFVFKSLALALRANVTVQIFHFSIGDTIEETDLVATEMAALLMVNSTLKEISNYSNSLPVSNTNQSLLHATLEKNTTLQAFQCFEEESSFTWRKETFLNRNLVASQDVNVHEDWLSPCGSLRARAWDASLIQQPESQNLQFGKELLTLYDQTKTKSIRFGNEVVRSCESLCQEAMNSLAICKV